MDTDYYVCWDGAKAIKAQKRRGSDLDAKLGIKWCGYSATRFDAYRWWSSGYRETGKISFMDSFEAKKETMKHFHL